jgi:hypothetical protein
MAQIFGELLIGKENRISFLACCSALHFRRGAPMKLSGAAPNTRETNSTRFSDVPENHESRDVTPLSARRRIINYET